MFLLYALVTFGSGVFFGYVGLLVFLEFYESQRPGPRAENRRDIHKVINRCAIGGAFVVGLISLGLYLARHAGAFPVRSLGALW